MKNNLKSSLVKEARDKLTQKQFAEILGVTQPMISAWEGPGDDEPSVVLWLKMAKLAPKSERLRFWKQAGIDSDDALEAARSIMTERTASPRDGEIVRVPKIGDPDAPMLPVPLSLVPDPSAVGYCVIDSPSKIFPIRQGDIVVLDTTASDSMIVESFWKRVVLAKQSRPANVKVGSDEWTLADEDFNGFYMGRLRCRPLGLGGRESREWVVSVLSFTQNSPFSPDSFDFPFGKVLVTNADWKTIGVSSSFEYLPAKEAELAKMRFKFYRGCSLLGRVIFWFRPAAHPAK
jgi:DNA-binding XRE family transcriptional regulator